MSGEASRPLEVFRLRGRAVDRRGKPLAQVGLSVVDRDPLRDDLLGAGQTRDDGTFGISFTRREFNQDLGENEPLPDLELVFWSWFSGKPRVVYRRTLPVLGFATGAEDVGDVVVETWGKEIAPLDDGDPHAGARKSVRRLDVTPELVLHCLDEVAPMVESLTGWPDLLEDVDVKICEWEAAYPANRLWQRLAFSIAHRAMGVAAMYDPDLRTIFVNRSGVARRLNLDAVKVTLGHELVHVGQFRAHPELAAALDEAEPEEVPAIMKRIEGYATYIESDFLGKHYNLAMASPTEPLLDGAIRESVMELVPWFGSARDEKMSQYSRGLALFRGRRGPAGRPAPFTLPRSRRSR